MTIEVVDDEDMLKERNGLSRTLPVLMDQADSLTIDDIEDIVEQVSTAPVILEEDAAATLEDLHKIDEIMQEFMRVRYPRRSYAEHMAPRIDAVPSEPMPAIKLDINEALRAVMEAHAQDMKNMGTLTEDDIPQLRAKWLQSCQDIMNGVPEELPPMRGVNHHILLIDENKWYHYHLPWCPDSMKVQLMEKITHYTRAGWWESVQTDQAPPMLCILKKSGLLCTTIDAHKRNDNTVKDVTPFLDQDQIHLDIARAKIWSKIDFSNAYKQIRTVPEDIHKSVFAMIYGTYVSHTMQIGDCNAPATFQRVMTMIFRDFIGIFLHAYLDDLFIYSNSVDEHEKHLALVFNKIHKFQFYLKEEKCKLYAEQVDCLGHMINHWGLHVDADKMTQIRNWRQPRNYNDVQKFVGLVQYLAHFLPDISSYTGPLSAMSKNSQPFTWRPLHDKCFEMIKDICCKTPVLVPVNHDKDDPIWVICNASVTGVGVMYSQGSTWQTC
jgi:hypothetical protein